MSYDEDLPFDKVIGSESGSEYLSDRTATNQWQILREIQTVRMPDGIEVDIYHLMVGLDVIWRPNITEITLYLIVTLPIGESIAAATWAGDISAGATDGYLRADKNWESQFSLTTAQRLDRYYHTRAPGADLMGDLDAWGIEVPDAVGSLADTLSAYYEPANVNANRKQSLLKFLQHYQFDAAAGNLSGQQAALDAMIDLVSTFASAWYRRSSFVGGGPWARKQRPSDVILRNR